MSRPSEAHQRRKNKDMWDMYTKLSEVREHGVAKYSHDWIMQRLSERFYLEPQTIIVKLKQHARERQSDPRQLRIDLPM